MMLFEESAAGILKLFHQHRVRYLIVGGLAVNYYGVARTTGDIDVWVQDIPENKTRLINALKEYGVQGAEKLADLPLLAGFTEIQLESGIYLDLMNELQTLKESDFGANYKNATIYKLKGKIPVKFISIEQLTLEKSKSKRAKDKEDARLLKKLIRMK